MLGTTLESNESSIGWSALKNTAMFTAAAGLGVWAAPRLFRGGIEAGSQIRGMFGGSGAAGQAASLARKAPSVGEWGSAMAGAAQLQFHGELEASRRTMRMQKTLESASLRNSANRSIRASRILEAMKDISVTR